MSVRYTLWSRSAYVSCGFLPVFLLSNGDTTPLLKNLQRPEASLMASLEQRLRKEQQTDLQAGNDRGILRAKGCDVLNNEKIPEATICFQ